METKIVNKEGYVNVSTHSWSKERINSFFDWDKNKTLGSVEMMFLPDILRKTKDVSKDYSRVFWSLEQTAELNISKRIKMAPKTALDYNEMLTTVLTVLEYHQQNPQIKLLSENGENHFLCMGDQRIFSLDFFELILKLEKNGKWSVLCNDVNDERLDLPIFYPVGSKVFFAIEPVP